MNLVYLDVKCSVCQSSSRQILPRSLKILSVAEVMDVLDESLRHERISPFQHLSMSLLKVGR